MKSSKFVSAPFSIVVLFLIGVGIGDSFDCNCVTKRQLLELLNIIPSQPCNPLQQSIITTIPKNVVTVPNPVGMIANGNDVYVTHYDSGSITGSVSRYDQDGELRATFSVPEGTPRFLEIKCNNLYVVSRLDVDNIRTIYVKSIAND